MAQLLDLPPELLEHLFSYLKPDLKTVCSLREVSRQIQRHIDHNLQLWSPYSYLETKDIEQAKQHNSSYFKVVWPLYGQITKVLDGAKNRPSFLEMKKNCYDLNSLAESLSVARLFLYEPKFKVFLFRQPAYLLAVGKHHECVALTLLDSLPNFWQTLAHQDVEDLDILKTAVDIAKLYETSTLVLLRQLKLILKQVRLNKIILRDIRKFSPELLKLAKPYTEGGIYVAQDSLLSSALLADELIDLLTGHEDIFLAYFKNAQCATKLAYILKSNYMDSKCFVKAFKLSIQEEKTIKSHNSITSQVSAIVRILENRKSADTPGLPSSFSKLEII